MKIDIHHLTRVEGHGNIVVNVTDGKIERCDWQVPESPRFFEAMVRGRHYSEVARVVSRICGICSVGHCLASLKATEAALGIPVSRQTVLLRNLLKQAETFDSHVVHALFLAAPDLLGAPSVFPLLKTHGPVIRQALDLKRFGHEWGAAIAGRTTHPTRLVPGGFSELPEAGELLALQRRLEHEILPALPGLVELIRGLSGALPRFERATQYLALHSDTEYGLYDGEIQAVSLDGGSQRLPVARYRECAEEYVDRRSTAKYARYQGAPYMAGALARFNNNHAQLHPEARRVADALGLHAPCFNPYFNTVAQVVEIVHSAHEGLRLLRELLFEGLHQEEPGRPSRFGEGAGAVEVPRGILFHSYRYDERGICLAGDCVIPTNQNHANIQADFEALVPALLARKAGEKEMALGLEMLVRAYDPCISCSTHYLDVTFRR